MKKLHFFLLPTIAFLFVVPLRASLLVLTNNTAISPLDASYDGADIVVSNCTVTVDGAHSFSSLLIGVGGVLTHTYLSSGSTTLVFNVTNEPQILDANFPATLLNSNVSGLVTVTDTNGLITYTNGVDYIQTNLSDGTTQIYTTTNSALPGYAVVLVSYTWTYSYNAGLYLNVTNGLNVAAGGSINATGLGYGGGLGSGHGFNSSGAFRDSSGAGHGGNGGISSSNAIGGICYGSLYQPATLGSGGGTSYAGNGGSGGGRIQIAAGGTVNIDGMISVNGADATNSRAGGGAGGSIWVVALNFSGAGSLTANGGAGEPIHGGGGGGGRISVQCGTNNFSGSLAAFGGNGWQSGGAGTVFIQLTNQNGSLLVDNGGRAGTNTPVALPVNANVTIRSNAIVTPSGSWSAGSVTIASGGKILATSLSQMTLNVTGTLAVQTGGTISADGLGYTAGSGSGPGHAYNASPYYPCSGAGHGGTGALGSPTNISASAGGTYGSQTIPNSGDFGSGGGTYSTFSFGGSGGGVLNLFVNGALQMDGIISANGGNGSGSGGGGGSGGGIAITATTITGGGTILANGGNGAGTGGGGGGGGRIMVNSTSNNFTGTILAAGGGGAGYGGAGTIYLQQPSASSYQLILDNAGHGGTNTPLQSIAQAALIVRGGAVGSANNSVNFASLNLFSNGWLAAIGTAVPSTLTFSFSGDATIQPGGGIIADALGYAAGVGTGAGGSYAAPPYPGNGAGHGGAGGYGYPAYFYSSSGGTTYDYIPSPILAGSGGGGATTSPGGRGGSVISLSVGGRLQVDGVISANASNGSGTGGGGGSGGSINLSAGTLAGTGAIRANGGNGVDSIGGGGGGGCIAIYFNLNNFSGNLTAYGGSGYNYGGAGTIYLKKNSDSRASLLVDNGGHAGANSATLSSSVTDLILQNGGIISANGTLAVANLTVSSNAWIFVTNGTQVATWILNATGNVTVQAGGGISADTNGYRQAQGSGAGGIYATAPYYPSGGGGHAGYGGNPSSYTASIGGNAGYDVLTAPTLAGGGGGGNTTYSIGGNGGGVIQMNVTGSLQVDGALSANGGNGTGTGGGGGAGGSINLNVGALLGSGVISANGGSGVNSVGGGGGGGNIACAFTSNLFTGTFSAFGGGGANYGGAGLVYLKTNFTGQSIVIADNAGHRNTNTPVAGSANGSGLIIRNGAVVTPASASSQVIANLLINSNGWLLPANNSGGILQLTVNGGAEIQSGGGIIVDALGSSQNSGIGHGSWNSVSQMYPGSGAGHGGYGGNGISNSVTPLGGITYDSTTSPSAVGSGGGGNPSYSFGNSGGGYVNLRVIGAMQLGGSISANGGNANTSGGGGAGGSLNLNFGSLAGSGGITANGGSGAVNTGGGGGGGRIAVYLSSNNFTGTISAFGGGGYAFGGAGTIYARTNSQNYGQLLLDNNNNAGTNTAFDVNNMDVTVQNRAVGQLQSSSSWSTHNILIRTNSALVGAGSSSAITIFANNLTIDAGGALSLDSGGYGAQSGTGLGYSNGNVRGGGGYGGLGGGNLTVSGYGKAYGSITSPVTVGSGGGTYQNPPYDQGGAGGGALQLQVAGLLTVNGRLSANGGNGDNYAGGGSGGSLYLSVINRLAGSGVISANGGAAGSTAGGGAGGRIALICNSNSFTGQFTAFGGTGIFPGGAGTIFSSTINGARTLTVDNGGIIGTNTPLGGSIAFPGGLFDLNIASAASVVPTLPLPLFNNFNLAAGGLFLVPNVRTQLVLAAKNNINLAGNLSADFLGYAQTNGPGAGAAVSLVGAGGGYGGAGGNSANGATGGTNYGSATQPVDFGSGGGNGANTITGGSEGGGAIRISAGGTLNIDGTLSANGDYGWQDKSGGGAGGSLWLAANTFTGLGNLSAAGGNGDLWNGGGGGGGRIAIYSPTNLFAGGTNVSGGLGAVNGQAGTIFLSSSLLAFTVVAQTPTGTVSNTVSYVDLTFSDAVDPATINVGAFTLTTPAGALPAASLTATATGANTVRVSFPLQNLIGNYSLLAPINLASIFGQPLQSYTGNFAIALPTISGIVSDTNGAPVAGVTVQPDGGLTGTTTDASGNYAIGVPPGWNGSLTPSFGTAMFVPGSLAFNNVTNSLTNQNFLMVPTIAPMLATSLSGTNLLLTWAEITGVTYQPWYSTNLMDWLPFGNAILGTNGPQQLILPIDNAPEMFFQIGATH